MRLMIAALLLAVATPALAQTPVERHGQLSVRGTQIVDTSGKPVVLRGMSLFWSQWQGKYYNEPAVRWLRDDWNVNVVRAAMAVDSEGYLKHPRAEEAKVIRVIDAAIKNGIYVIVDWHAHEPHPGEAAAFFGRIARKYGHTPNIIYETYNEPLPKHGWKEVLKPYHQQVIGSIRAADPDNLVIAGTRSWSQDVDEAAADPLPFTNVAYTMHYYAGTHRQPLRDKTELAMKRGAAIFVTEYGTTEATGDGPVDVAESQRWWDFLEKHKISYLNWSIADKRESSAAVLPGASPTGGWKNDQVSQSGKLVREQLRKMNTPAAAK